MIEMFSVMQFKPKPDYLYCIMNINIQMLGLASHLPILTICSSILFLQNMFSKAFNITSNGIAALMTSTDKHLTGTAAKSFSLRPFTKISLGRCKTRGSKSKCSKLKRQHLLSKGQDPVFVILNPKHLMIIIP